MHDIVKVLHLIIHDAVKPHRRLFPGIAVHDGAVHLRAVIDSGAVSYTHLDVYKRQAQLNAELVAVAQKSFKPWRVVRSGDNPLPFLLLVV